jgi:hypothetical protein
MDYKARKAAEATAAATEKKAREDARTAAFLADMGLKAGQKMTIAPRPT